MILAMRARQKPPLPVVAVTLPVVAVTQRARPSAVPSAVPGPTVENTKPPADEGPIDECPEFVLLAEKLVDAAAPHETILMNGHIYYKLPPDFPQPSKELRDRLHKSMRCNNCADST